MTFITILGMVAALGFGIYWGLPPRYEASQEEIDKKLGEKGEHATVRRHFTPMALLQRKVERGSDRRRSRRTRKPFQTH